MVLGELKSKSTKYISYLVWLFLLVSYNFQFPFKELSDYITPLFFLYFLLNVKELCRTVYSDVSLKLFYVFAILLTLNLMMSTINGIPLENSIRFYAILLGIPLCFGLVKEKFIIEYKIFIGVSVVKSIYLIVLAAWMVYVGAYEPFRIWAQHVIGNGDMFFVYGFIPRIQLQGNALLLMALFISIARNNKITKCGMLFLLGVLIEGNFSFYLGLVFFIIYLYIKNNSIKKLTLKKCIAGLLLLASLIGFYNYADSQREAKDTGQRSVREKQIEILMDTNELYGSGLGQRVPGNTKLGRSDNATYFELQTLYIYYQIGFMGILLFYCIVFRLLFQLDNKDALYIYIAYMIYSFFNPYCFDTTNCIVAILCANYSRIVNR